MSHVVSSNGSTKIEGLLKDKITLSRSIEELRNDFRDAKPFSHLTIDNLFPNSLLEKLIDEIPPVTDKYWVHHDDERVEKFGLRSAVDLGQAGDRLTALLHSAAFLYFLSEVSGIWQLLPDPYLQGGGYSLLPEGAKFDVHVDRSTAYEAGLYRRLSLLIYLNKDWKPEYGGQLELWNSDGTSSEVAIEPLFNRTVIFQINDHNYHGVPNPIAAPGKRSRNSFTVYYHTALPAGENVTPHTSIYAPAFYSQKSHSLRTLVKDLTPPILLHAFRRVRPPQVY